VVLEGWGRAARVRRGAAHLLAPSRPSALPWPPPFPGGRRQLAIVPTNTPGPTPYSGVGDGGADEGCPAWARGRVPEPWDLEGPAVSISLGDAADVDPALLAAMCGPDGLGGQAIRAGRRGGGAAVLSR
jgi:hypothetical protein